MVLEIWQNKVCVGYVRSVNYATGRCSMTSNLGSAKRSYRSIDEAMYDIDVLTRGHYQEGKVFNIGMG